MFLFQQTSDTKLSNQSSNKCAITHSFLFSLQIMVSWLLFFPFSMQGFSTWNQALVCISCRLTHLHRIVMQTLLNSTFQNYPVVEFQNSTFCYFESRPFFTRTNWFCVSSALKTYSGRSFCSLFFSKIQLKNTFLPLLYLLKNIFKNVIITLSFSHFLNFLYN